MSEIANGLADLEEEKVAGLVREKLAAGIEPATILAELREGMDICSAVIELCPKRVGRRGWACRNNPRFPI